MLDLTQFSSTLAESMIRFLRYKQALGRTYKAEYFRLKNLDRFLTLPIWMLRHS